jgi:hypothetical protein
MPLAFGVAPPSSLSSAPFAAPEPDGLAGDERKNKGDCVAVVADCSRLFRGVACDPRCEAWDASDCNCSSGPTGAGLLEGIAPRALRRGVAEAEVRCERRCAGEDMTAVVYTDNYLGYRGVVEGLLWGHGTERVRVAKRVLSQSGFLSDALTIFVKRTSSLTPPITKNPTQLTVSRPTPP